MQPGNDGKKNDQKGCCTHIWRSAAILNSNQFLLKSSASSECWHRWETSVGAKATSSAISLTLRPTSTHSRTSSLRTAESDLVAKSYPCDASSQAGCNPLGSAKESGGIAVSQKKTIRALTRLTKGCATTKSPKTSDNPSRNTRKRLLCTRQCGSRLLKNV